MEDVQLARDAAVSSRAIISGAIASELGARSGGWKRLVSAANMEVEVMGLCMGKGCTVGRYEFEGVESLWKRDEGGIGFCVAP